MGRRPDTARLQAITQYTPGRLKHPSNGGHPVQGLGMCKFLRLKYSQHKPQR